MLLLVVSAAQMSVAVMGAGAGGHGGRLRGCGPLDGNAFIERMFRTLKEAAIWPNEFDRFDQALAAMVAWMCDHNHDRSQCEPLSISTPATSESTPLKSHVRFSSPCHCQPTPGRACLGYA